MSEQEPSLAPNPQDLVDKNLAHDMANASDRARSEAAASRARMEAHPGTDLAYIEKFYNQHADAVAERQENAVQAGSRPEGFDRHSVREQAKNLGVTAFLAGRNNENKAA